MAGTDSDGGSPNMHSLQLVCNWDAAARPGLRDSPKALHTPSLPPDVLRAPGGLSKACACCRAIRWAETWFSYGCPAASSWNKLLCHQHGHFAINRISHLLKKRVKDCCQNNSIPIMLFFFFFPNRFAKPPILQNKQQPLEMPFGLISYDYYDARHGFHKGITSCLAKTNKAPEEDKQCSHVFFSLE